MLLACVLASWALACWMSIWRLVNKLCQGFLSLAIVLLLDRWLGCIRPWCFLHCIKLQYQEHTLKMIPSREWFMSFHWEVFAQISVVFRRYSILHRNSREGSVYNVILGLWHRAEYIEWLRTYNPPITMKSAHIHQFCTLLSNVSVRHPCLETIVPFIFELFFHLTISNKFNSSCYL